jgi:hypothetical protein
MKIVVSSVEKAANSEGHGLPSLWGRRASCLSVLPTTQNWQAGMPASLTAKMAVLRNPA